MSAADHSRVVDQQANLAEFAPYHSGAFAHRAERRQVAVDHVNRRTRGVRADLLTQRCCRGDVAAQHDHGASSPGQLAARHPSDAMGGAGNDGDFAHRSARQSRRSQGYRGDPARAKARRVRSTHRRASWSSQERFACHRRHNRAFAASHRSWFEAVYKDKYEYMGEWDLMSLAFRLDLGLYYLGIVSQPFKYGERALLIPPFSAPACPPVVRCGAPTVFAAA